MKQLNTTSLRIIPYLENHADFDGLITVPKWRILDEELMARTSKSYNKAIEDLISVGLVRRSSEDQLFLNYKVNYFEGFYGIDHDSYFKEKIRYMFKRRILLFYYFYLLGCKEWNSVAIEKCYGDSVFSDYSLASSYSDLMTNLIPLIEAGFIQVKLGASHTVITEKDTDQQVQIQNFIRESLQEDNELHFLYIHINPQILKDTKMLFTTRFDATLQDMDDIAQDYGSSIWWFSEDELTELYRLKYEIYSIHGDHGMKIFRGSLKAFFDIVEYSWRFEYLVERKWFFHVFRERFFDPLINSEELK